MKGFEGGVWMCFVDEDKLKVWRINEQNNGFVFIRFYSFYWERIVNYNSFFG